MTKTLSQLDAETAAARQRAAMLESLQSDQSNLTGSIRIQNSKLEARENNIAALKKTLKALESVSDDVKTTGRGTGFAAVPSGMSVKSLFSAVLSSALAIEEEQRDIVAESIQRMTDKRVEVEAALKEFTD